ncbi:MULTISPECIES: prepilin-type N-terminal cleavage/methylation domain-containing protein [unclassified Ensifer]|uniref:prepilin-type N-terminal cleavage/methylation domain-containing protein n=1 Tax=unclassified Ensifer TaxID=2633371 RepID=UPI000813D782|nr:MULTISPECIES: prepilin-type N-terminal cleavage/methylation domain-containing protein [unclassified Ensifer]OCP25177.1 prepilin-type N-terminal cleavage/methylation domain-containing protein [Ensifer sp. LC54]OCP25490.1 prepilin-type N-terminal cleavage/methylation domain-containing protein [Ensifer sp. LC384]
MTPHVVRREVAKDKCRGDAGFTLLEVLVAVAILAAVVSVVPRSLVSARASIGHSRAWLEARLVAEEVLAGELRNGRTRPGVFSGEVRGRQWRVVVVPAEVADAPPGNGRALLEARISVEVSASRVLAVDRLLVGVAQ